MTPIEWIFAGLTAFGLLVHIGMRLATGRTLARKVPDAKNPLPITVLKPMKGADPSLADNLRSIFRQNYPTFQLVIGSPDHDDPAMDIAREVAKEFPNVDVVIESGSIPNGHNPKVNSLSNLYQHAKHELVLISDSNVIAPENYLANLMAHYERDNAGLVTSPFRGVDPRNAGASLEQLQLNTFVVGGLCGMNELLGMTCVIGKSMMMHRDDLAKLGGFEFLSRFLGEDQVCGEEIAKLGKRVVVADVVIDNVLGATGFKGFLARHSRWALIRRHIAPAGYVGELLLNPVGVALIGLAVTWSINALLVLAGALVARTLVDWSYEALLKVKRNPLIYPFAVLLRDVLILAAWPRPLFQNSIHWRGDRVRIRRRSELLSLELYHEKLPSHAEAKPAEVSVGD